MANEMITLMPLKVGNFITYETYFDHFEVELYPSNSLKQSGGEPALDSLIERREVSGTKINNGSAYTSDYVVFEDLVKNYYYFIRYRVVTESGNYSDWSLEEQSVGDETFSFTADSTSVRSDKSIIRARITAQDVPVDFSKIKWFVRDDTTTIPYEYPGDFVTDTGSANNIFKLDFPSNSNKKIYYVAFDASNNPHSETAHLVGDVKDIAGVENLEVDEQEEYLTVEFDYNYVRNDDDFDNRDIQKFEVILKSIDESGNTAVETKYMEIKEKSNWAGAGNNEHHEDSFQIDVGKEYMVKINAVNSIGMRSGYVTEKLDSTPPPDLTSGDIDVSDQLDGIYFSVNSGYSEPGDIKGYQWVIKAGSSPAAPTDSEILPDPIYGNYLSRLWTETDSQTINYWVRAVDTSGNTSNWLNGSFTASKQKSPGAQVFSKIIVMG